jgi:hypothetical protein
MALGVGNIGGVTPVSSNGANAIAIGNAVNPKEGPKAIPYNLDFSVQTAYSINILYLYQQNIISVIQVIYVDNSQNVDAVTILVSQTSQRIIVPAGDEGYFPILCPTNGVITVSSGGGVQVPLFLINVPMQCLTWSPSGGAAAGFQFDPAGNLKTADQPLQALISNIAGAGNALDVNVLHTVGGGGGGFPVDTWGSGTATFGGPGDHILVAAVAGKTITIGAIDITATQDAFLAAGSKLNIQLFDNLSGVTFLQRNFYMPTAAIAAGLAFVPPMNILSMTALNIALTPSSELILQFTTGGGGLDGGNLICSVLFNQA